MPNDTVRASATALPIPNRRLFLAAGSAAAVFATVKRAAGSAGPTDPTFAAIERHREAWRLVVETESDEPAYEAIREAEQEALDALFALPPITVAGMRAAIEWMVKYDDGCVPETSGAFLATLLDSPLLAEGRADV
jgi:hypothetical protein